MAESDGDYKMMLIPFISSICYLIGGQGWKIARWLIGLPIFIIAIICGYPWYSIFAVLTYFIATNVFSYGDNMWTTKLLGKWASFVLSGFMFGLASVSVLRWELCLLQAFLGAIFFSILKYLDDNEIVKNPFQEFLRGFVGTCVYAI